jgi:hypothetical protein
MPVDRKRYCEAMAKVADAYCDLMESMGSVKEPVQTTQAYKWSVDPKRESGQLRKALEQAVQYLQLTNRNDGICYVVSTPEEFERVVLELSIKHGLVETIYGFPAAGALYVKGSPLYIRCVRNMKIPGKNPLYVMDHTVRELLAEKT